jgi:hypothetical protein
VLPGRARCPLAQMNAKDAGETGYDQFMAVSALVRRTKQYFGFGPLPTDPPPHAPSTARLILGFSTFLGCGVVFAILGNRTVASTLIGVSLILAVCEICHRRFPPPVDRAGWYRDPSGGGRWLWWDGSEWRDRPAGGEGSS